MSGLTIGLASCLMLLLYVGYEWNFDRQFGKIDRIYGVCKNYTNNGDTATYGPVSYALPNLLVPTALEQVPGIEAASRTTSAYRLLSYRRQALNMSALFADPDFFKIFDYTFLEGHAGALLDPNAVVMTARAARKMFGESDAIGRAVTWDNRRVLKVGAVIADPAPNQTYQFDVMMNWTFLQQDEPTRKYQNWGSGFSNAVVLLKAEADFGMADRAMRQLIRKNQADLDTEAFLFPFAKTHLYNRFENGKATGGTVDQVRIFFLLAVCVLLIACINYMNLSTARSEKRAQEVGIRKTLGSDRTGLALQFLNESLVLTVIALVVAFVLVELCLPFFNNLLQISMHIDYGSHEIWLLLLLLALLTGALAGSYPALYLSSFSPMRALKGVKGGRPNFSFRKLLVILQFGCSVCMIVGAIVIYRQIAYLKNKPLGFNDQNLLEMRRTGRLENESANELLKSALLRSGAVMAISGLSTSLTNNGNNSDDVSWPGKQANERIVMNIRTTDRELAQTLGLTTAAGRGFDAALRSDSSGVVLNESAASAMRLGKEGIGKQIWFGGQAYTVLGIWKNFSYESSAYRVSPTLFFKSDSGRRKTNTLLIRLNPAMGMQASLEAVQELFQKFNPGYPAETTFISESLAGKLENERRLGVLANVFGGFAIFISCLGLLGLALYMAEQRSKEVSIRKVLGADVFSILVLLNKDFISLVLVANLLACPLAWVIASRWLERFDYRAAPGVWPFAAAVLISLVVALLAVSLQTWKIARSNPAAVLKHE
ncbi:ABC transporter permease [Pedobacter yulinensis]|nr:ABC transporter permease [Pedobacter yulinensis]